MYINAIKYVHWFVVFRFVVVSSAEVVIHVIHFPNWSNPRVLLHWRWGSCVAVWLILGVYSVKHYPDSKVHGANMGTTWGRQDPGGPHVGLMNPAFWGNHEIYYTIHFEVLMITHCNKTMITQWPAIQPATHLSSVPQRGGALNMLRMAAITEREPIWLSGNWRFHITLMSQGRQWP